MFDFRDCFILFLFAAINEIRHITKCGQAPACFHRGLSRLSEVTIFVTDACMLNPVREGGED